jgi:hypothetical protein
VAPALEQAVAHTERSSVELCKLHHIQPDPSSCQGLLSLDADQTPISEQVDQPLSLGYTCGQRLLCRWGAPRMYIPMQSRRKVLG